MNGVKADAKAIFLEALDCPSPDELMRFLEQACGTNSSLRARVEELLRAHREAGAFLGGPQKQETTWDQPVSESVALPGTVIGQYKLLEQIGEGGFGVVFMAEQQEPIRRKVALKVLKPGMDTRQVIARFEAERQALALMDHPNIAKVLDGGTTGPNPPTPFPKREGGEESSPSPLRGGGRGEGFVSGRPYFVMDLVKGVPITDHCDQNHLTPRQRLELFIPVCHAVQHAHQKGVIHRDLKPSNVLVAPYDGKPVPKVIDFGVAKATGSRLTDRTLFTAFGAVVGTLEYMSPEQAELNNQDVDTRSDLFSLGVLLYELLTGTTPLDRKRVKESSLLEVLRLIREEEPPRPSTRLSASQTLPSIAANRGLEPNKLRGLVRGELDWIVMKCLEKDRNRRYETANGLARDIERYLRNEAVQACPPSTLYRLRKFVRRHRGPVLAAGVIVLLLLGGIIGTTAGLLRAVAEGEQKDEARKAAQRNLQKAHQAVHDYFTRVSEDTLLRRPDLEPLRRKLLADALRYYRDFVDEHGDDPGLRAELAATYFRIAVLSHELGPDVDWLPAFQKCVALVEELLRDKVEPASLLGLRDGIYRVRASSTLHCRDPQAAVVTMQKACALWQELARQDPTAPGFRNDLAGFLQVIGFMCQYAGKVPESVHCYEQACALYRQLTQEHPRDVHYRAALASILTGMSQCLTIHGRVADAEAAGREALAIEQQLIDEQPDVPDWRDLQSGYTAWELGAVLEHAGKPKEAEQAYRKMLDGLEALLREYPAVPRYRSGLLRGRQWLGELLWATGRREEAAEQYRQARALGEKIGPADVESRNWLAWTLATCPDPEFRDAVRAVETARAVVKVASDNGIYWITLGAALYATGDYRAAAEALEKATQLPNRDISYARFLLAMTCWQLGDKTQARKWYDLAAAEVDLLEVRYAEILRFRAEAEKMLKSGP